MKCRREVIRSLAFRSTWKINRPFTSLQDKLNAYDAETRQYLYHEITVQYTWQTSHRRWTRRRRRMGNDTLARMYVVNPLDRYRFHLRLLLLHNRSPQSFQDIQTVDEVVYESYAAAAVAMGLIESD